MSTGRASKNPSAFLSCLSHVKIIYFIFISLDPGLGIKLPFEFVWKITPFYSVYTITWFGVMHQRQLKRLIVNSLFCVHLLHKLTWVNLTNWLGLNRLSFLLLFFLPLYPLPFFLPPLLDTHIHFLQICCDWEFSPSEKTNNKPK